MSDTRGKIPGAPSNGVFTGAYDAATDFEGYDQGVKKLVRLLRSKGFNTTDSGDGVSKPKEERVLDFPHVFMSYSSVEQAKEEATRLYTMLTEMGVKFGFDLEVEDCANLDDLDIPPIPWIEVSWSPIDNVALVGLTNVTDNNICW